MSSRVISWPLLRRTSTDNSNELGQLWPLLSFAVLTAVSVRNEEAGGSSPLPSTILLNNLDRFRKLQELPAIPSLNRAS